MSIEYWGHSQARCIAERVQDTIDCPGEWDSQTIPTDLKGEDGSKKEHPQARENL